MHRFFRKGIFFVFPIAVAAAVLVLALIAQCFHLNDSRIHINHAQPYSDGWTVASRQTDGESGDTLLLSNVLPQIPAGDYVLCFRSDSEKIRVYVDDEEIYSYGWNDQTPFGRWFGSLWNMIEMQETFSGKTISVEITDLSSEIYGDTHVFYLDQQDRIILTLLTGSWPIIANCIVAAVACITMFISGILHLCAGSKAARAHIYLSIFVLLSQIYVFCDAGFLQYITSNKAIGHFCLYSALMLLPVPFALYLSEIVPRWRQQYRIWSLLYCGYYSLRLLLYMLDIVEIGQYLSLTLMFIALGMCYAALTCFSNTSQASSRILLAGILFFFVSVLIAMMLYLSGYTMIRTMPLYSFILAVGIDCLMIFFYIALLKSSVSTATRAQIYERQAYTDALTLTYNRAAFNLTLPILDDDAHPHLTLLMLDLNNLKQVNDTLGHPAGDKLICILANCLKQAFDDVGDIYRYGGDEFVVVIPDAALTEAQAARTRLDQLILEYRQHGSYEISAAVGMASRQLPGQAHKSVMELLHIADAAMYHVKAEQKAVPDFAPTLLKRLDQIDALTGILSFPAFKTHIYNTLMNAQTRCPCIVSFDLNFFDGYNKLFGWNAGNLLLQKMAQMAMQLCGKSGFCAHDYADSYWVFVDAPSLDVLTERIVSETRAFQSKLDDCLLFPSFGVYCISDRNLPVSDMCSRAASAKKRVKGRLDVLYAVYSTEEHQHRTDNMKLISYMQKALDSDEFVPFYQPKFTRGGRLAGAEALVRWPNASGKPSSPAEFTALFEKSGLILSLDWYMLEKTCRFLQKQLEANLACVPVSNNFSRLHIFEEGCLERLCQTADQYHIPHNLIEIELTETALVEDGERVFELISAMQAEGFSVSLDDFGSGVSSLGSLNNLRVNTIKIDRSLIENRDSVRPNNCIFEFVVRLCRQLHIHTLAEGVETQAQFDRLCRCGCELVQGNYFSAALNQQDFENLLIARQDELKQGGNA